jgi:hypothetical protein
MRSDLIVTVHLGQAPDAVPVAQIVNQTISYCIWFAVVIVIVQLVKDLRRLVSSERAAAPARST